MPNISSGDEIINIMPHVTDPHMKSKYPAGKVSPKVLMKEMDVDDDEFEIPRTEAKTKEEETKTNYMNIAYIVLALVIIALVILVVYMFLKQNDQKPVDMRPVLVPQNRIPPMARPADMKPQKTVSFKDPIETHQPVSQPALNVQQPVTENANLTADIPRDNVSKEELENLDKKVSEMISSDVPETEKANGDDLELSEDDRKYMSQFSIEEDVEE